MKHMIIMRGISGAGKSTFVEHLKKIFPDLVHCSADFAFMKDGEYKFDPTLLRLAHTSCFREANHAAIEGAGVIVIDNTNTQHWEMAPYILLGQSYDYRVQLVKLEIDVVTAAKRNLHGVPEKNVAMMESRFQKPLPFWPKESVFTNPTFDDVRKNWR